MPTTVTNKGKERRELSVVFDPDLPLFAHHLPGSPCVPGSLVTGVFLTMLEDLEEGRPEDVDVRRFRFRRFLVPGTYTFVLETDGEAGAQASGQRTARCRVLADDGVPVAEGVLAWSEQQA